ncbi:uncharacterized protein LOC117915475 isoform X2 [Vitis riparia]|uniref:uncharacterized protein LOC117915475 isoform X2 n=1 Tax=Vitis riparia TaxID=96939 RepID=UPI00155A5CE3|nr:uncharacterized protein LOC117915475 isoform X2 [Vitis riparia]
MGCRESKLDVVTGNTISQSKKSNADPKRIAPPETRPDDKSGGLEEAAAEGDDAVMVNGKEGETRELDREREGNEGEEKEKEMERSISRESPNHYFSSRKDNESIDAIAIEERSEYSSPPNEAAEEEPRDVKEENFIKESELVTPQTKVLSIE